MSQRQEIEIRALSHGGEGIGHAIDPNAERLTWFVPGTLPGERVNAEIQRRSAGWVHAKALEVVQASPHRMAAPCPLAGTCGGCTWQHIDPQQQARLKAEIVQGQLRKVVATIDAVHASPQWQGYRRRARLHVARQGESVSIGFHRAGSHEVIDVEACMVLDEPCNHALRILRARPDLLPAEGEVWLVSNGRSALVGLTLPRHDKREREAFQSLLDATLVGVHLRGGRQSAILGRAEIWADDAEKAMALPLRPFGFAQAQEAQNAKLVERVRLLAQGPSPTAERDVLELFCGVGNFTRALVGEAHFVWACDDDREAIARLRQSARRFGWRCEAQHRSALACLRRAVEAQRTFPTVVLDPPRSGLGVEGASLLAQVASQRIVYVSCDPATLARDAQVLVQAGFAATSCEVFDLMPMTPEVEVVLTLDRRTQPTT